MKRILGIFSAPASHWVGGGFPVRSLFSCHSHSEYLSPFLLLDYAGPAPFEPTIHRRGVGEHPHRGFETVTIVYRGEVGHSDSTGSGGKIGPGDVQWMTAGSGILHEEFHSAAFAKDGGTLEMVQLWINLPAHDKMTLPSYQTLLNADIPRVQLPQHAGSVRIIAGECAGHRGPARTFSAMDVWDGRLTSGGRTRFSFGPGRTLTLAVLQGAVQINGADVIRGAQTAVMDSDAGDVLVEAGADAMLLILSGEPLKEPVVSYGSFVMNNEQQIAQAIEDFNSGRFGFIAPQTWTTASH